MSDTLGLQQFFAWFQRKISPQAFTRVALILSGVWFLGVYPVLNYFAPRFLPGSLRVFSCDFGQYYAGATVAKNGIWDALYPIVRPGVYDNPPVFRPVYKTFLFDERKIDGRMGFYPTIAEGVGGEFSPKLLAYCPELAGSFHFICPPPLPLLLWPLAYFDYDTLENHLWPILSMAALFGLSYFSSRIHRLLRGRASYTEGLIMAALVSFSLFGPLAVSNGNVTPILGCLVAFVAYGWMRGWQIGVGAAMIPLLLFKALGLNWCPLLLLRLIRWKTLLTMVFFTALLNGCLLFWVGTGVYRQYFLEILPKLTAPVGQGMVSEVFRLFGFFPSKVYFLLSLALCLLLYFGYWKGPRAKSNGERRAVIAATLAGAMAVFCLLNVSVQRAYFFVFLYFPFLGWMSWEARQAVGRWHRVIATGMMVFFVIIPFNWCIARALFYLCGPKSMEFYHGCISPLSVGVLLPLFFLVVAFRRLFFAPLVETPVACAEREGLSAPGECNGPLR